jgi:hypothetical protein
MFVTQFDRERHPEKDKIRYDTTRDRPSLCVPVLLLGELSYQTLAIDAVT